MNLTQTTLPEPRTAHHGLRTTDYGPLPRSAAFRLQKRGITLRRRQASTLPSPFTLLQPKGCAPGPWRQYQDTPGRFVTGHAAFTLVEILVTSALLAFIVVGLFAMFNQVQRAFRSSMNQVDQLEAGRAVTEMLPRELEQIIPAGYPYPNGVNFYAQIPNPTPLTQSLPGTPVMRTNLLEDCFMLLRQNQTWTGIGYCVRTDDGTGRLYLPQCGSGTSGVGSLYRYAATINVLQNNGLPADVSQLYSNFVYYAAQPGSAAISNRICDGVIHFRLRAFATNGFPIYVDSFSQARFRTNAYNTGSCMVKQVSSSYYPYYPDNWSSLSFLSNAVPAAVELELGILEQHALERYNSIGDPNARLAYLQRPDISSRVQLFRQRIPIRNVDPLAYQ